MKKFVSVIFAFLMIISLYQSTNVLAIDGSLNLETEEVELVRESIYKKIHFYLDVDEYSTIDSREELIRATNYAVKDYAVIQYEQAASKDEQFNSYQITVEFASDFVNTETYKALMKERETITTISEVHEFRSRLNSYSKEYHTQLVNKSMKSVEGMDYSEANPIAYSPFVVLDTPVNNISVDALADMANQDNVMNISVSTEVDDAQPIEVSFDVANTSSTPNSWEKMLRNINAYDIVTNGTLTGEGIRIGILEASGVCDKTNLGLSDKDITTYEGQADSSHATLVTLIAAQIAPEAKFYVSKVVRGEFLKWFIENNCDVINCSFAQPFNTTNSNGTYNDDGYEYRYDYDAIYDYQIQKHKITVVKSAGNKNTNNTSSLYNPNSKISSPGYAFNAITVGGVTADSLGDLTHHPNSCYVSDYPSNKPNVTAKHVIVGLPNYSGSTTISGTSVAAPQVTGCIALLMQSNSQLIDKPEIIMSLISSTARESDDYIADTDTSLDDKVGAGVIDLERMINNSDIYSIYNTNGEFGDTIFSYNVSLNAGDEIQIALAWLAGTNGVESGSGVTVTETYVNDYDLFLYYLDDDFAAGSVVVASSTCMDNNVEMIRYTVSTSGMYTIAFHQFDDIPQSMDGDDIALTYNIE